MVEMINFSEVSLNLFNILDVIYTTKPKTRVDCFDLKLCLSQVLTPE